ncbi:glutathione hydrolase 1 proenzyme isoform X2 [Exaiptasia diaphana]|nr:glutathione hydrolase 1 proenzyme isoform X2 [Exaiptasia diaphana]
MEVADAQAAEKEEKVLKFGRRTNRRAIIIGVVVAVVVVAIIVAVVVTVVTLKKSTTQKTSTTDTSSKSPPLLSTLPSPTSPPPLPTAPPNADGPYREAVVAADSGKCSEIGRDIMRVKKGSAVDAAIATLFCIGVMNMHSAGIGGGGFIVVYNRSNNFTETFDFREQAPGVSHQDMFVNGTLNSRVGGAASGVPGEVRGFLTAWKKYGRLPWKELVQPSIDLTKNGLQIGENVYYAMTRSSVKQYIFSDPGLRELLVNETGQLKQKGEVIKMPKLARTLERISENPEDFYTGELAKDIVSEIKEAGGLITLDDMKNYTVKIRKTLVGTLGDYHWYSMPPPGSGSVLGLILNILKGYNMNSESRKDTNSSILTYHRITEAFKFAYAYRALLGDPDFVDLTHVLKNITDPNFGESLRQRIYDNMTFTNYRYYGDFYSAQGGGTSHMSLMAPNGDAVSATTTINLFFGSKFRGPKTGIMWNNEMDDFSIPNKKNAFGVLPSPANYVMPGKRPLSSMAPSIFVDKNGEVRMVSGASGGTRITTATSLSVMNFLWFNRTLSQSVTDPRIHHQLMPMYIRVDRDYPISQEIIDGLERLGHDVRKISGFAVVQATAKDKDGLLFGKSDPRKGGWAAGY